MNIIDLIRRLFNRQKWTKPPEIDYNKRKEEMLYLRNEEGLTDTAIGKRYGLSRERVRQILGNKGRDFRRKWTRNIINSGKYLFKNISELSRAPGLKSEWLKDWGKQRHIAKEGGFVRAGQEFEEAAGAILRLNDIDHELMPNHCAYDIKTENGAKIEVTVTNFDVSGIESQNSKYPTWAVPVRRKDAWDFLFVFIPEETHYCYYVIPSSALSHIKRDDTRIRIPHPRMSQKPSKWHQFYKRVDLIKNYTV